MSLLTKACMRGNRGNSRKSHDTAYPTRLPGILGVGEASLTWGGELGTGKATVTEPYPMAHRVCSLPALARTCCQFPLPYLSLPGSLLRPQDGTFAKSTLEKERGCEEVHTALFPAGADCTLGQPKQASSLNLAVEETVSGDWETLRSGGANTVSLEAHSGTLNLQPHDPLPI